MWDFEFYSDPLTGEGMYRRIGGHSAFTLTPECHEVISFLLLESKTFYPGQYAALCEEYKWESDRMHYDFYRARRIINCCFADRDNPPALDGSGNYRFRPVRCPLIAECRYYKVICVPEFQEELSWQELEVLRSYLNRYPETIIAEELSLSVEALRNHRRNGLRRLRMTFGQFAEYACTTSLFGKMK